MPRAYMKQGEYQGGLEGNGSGAGVSVPALPGVAVGGNVGADLARAVNDAGQSVLKTLAGEYRERQTGLVDEAILDVSREFEIWKKDYQEQNQGRLALNAQADFMAKWGELAEARYKDFGNGNEIFRDLLRQRLVARGLQAASEGGRWELGQSKAWLNSQWDAQVGQFRNFVMENPGDSEAIEFEFNELMGSWQAKNPGLDPTGQAARLWEDITDLRMNTLLADESRTGEAEALLADLEQRGAPGWLRGPAQFGDGARLGRKGGFSGGMVPQGSFIGKMPANVETIVREKARKYGLPEDLLLAVAMQESGGRQESVSRAGAIGVMQLMPNTARQLGVDPRNLEQNIDGGARYLAQMLEKDGDLYRALLRYNWGPGNVEAWLKTGKGTKGQTMPKEARDYANAVGRHMGLSFDGAGRPVAGGRREASTTRQGLDAGEAGKGGGRFPAAQGSPAMASAEAREPLARPWDKIVVQDANGRPGTLELQTRRPEMPPNSPDYVPPGAGFDAPRKNLKEYPMSPEAAAYHDSLRTGKPMEDTSWLPLTREKRDFGPLPIPQYGPDKREPINARPAAGISAGKIHAWRTRLRQAKTDRERANVRDAALETATLIFNETRGMSQVDRNLHTLDRLGQIPDLDMRRKASLILRETFNDEDKAQKIRDDEAAREILREGDKKHMSYLSILAACRQRGVSQSVIDRLEIIREGRAKRPTLDNIRALRDGLIAVDKGRLKSTEERIAFAYEHALTVTQRRELMDYAGSESGISLAQFEEMLQKAGYEHPEYSPELYRMLPQFLPKGKTASMGDVQTAVMALLWKGVNGTRFADAALFNEQEEWRPEIPSDLRKRYQWQLKKYGLADTPANIERRFREERFGDYFPRQVYDKPHAEEKPVDLEKFMPWEIYEEYDF